MAKPLTLRRESAVTITFISSWLLVHPGTFSPLPSPSPQFSDILSLVRAQRIFFSLATFVGSALLFLIQPMAAKMLLPIFGGSPAVWTAAMLFFQVALLGGYAFAHFSNLYLGPTKQRYIQIGFLLLALLTLPVTTHSSLFKSFEAKATETSQPALLVFGLLLMTVGAGYFIVSSGSPVLQRWFATTKDPNAKDPYFLYALSNVGSMVGLFAYPFIIEPRFGLSEQAVLWRNGFIVLLGIFAICTFFIKAPEVESAENKPEPPKAISWDQRSKWMFYAAVPSSLLLGATSYISSNIAPVPLIWVVPLAVYLLSFTLAFATKPLLKSAQLARILPILVVPLVFTQCIEATEPLVMLASFHVIILLVAGWMCHSLLAEQRPPATQLTEFYLWLSVGGAIGGLFNSLIAPHIFATYAEYPLAIVLACLVRPQPKPLSKDLVWFGAIAIISFVAMLAIKSTLPAGQLRAGLAIGIPLVAVFAAMDRVKVFAAGLGLIFVGVNFFQIAAPGQVLATRRSFFGVHRVLESKDYLSLVHGNTTHGRQSTIEEFKNLPLTYYHPTGPIGQIFTKAPIMERVHKVGLVGLGVGSLAAYGKVGQDFTYFEIDPEVLYLARDSGFFSFLKDAKAKMTYVLGDARLTLAKEPDHSYDLLVLDAFSSDAIPTHLLTLEAIQMYERKLAPGGIIAMHISNRYLELAPVIALTCRKANLWAFNQVDAPSPSSEEERLGKTQSNWLVILRNPGERDNLWKPMYWNDIDIAPSVKAWTDDYVNVLGAYHPEN
jgi:SAM-dependent methyltransferase